MATPAWSPIVLRVRGRKQGKTRMRQRKMQESCSSARQPHHVQVHDKTCGEWEASRRGPLPRPPSRLTPVARPTPQRCDLLRGDPGRAWCGWWRPLAAPRRRSRQYNPRQQPSGPCSLRQRLCSRSACTKASPGTRSGNGASPKSCRDDTRLNGSSPPRREPYDVWPWWAARSTRPTPRLRPPSQRMMASSGSRRWCTSRGAAKRAPAVATLLQALRRSKTSLAVPGTSLQGVVRTERQPWETADPEVVDPAPPGHVLQLV